MYNDDVLPKYLSGAAYIMSTDVVPHLYKTCLKTKYIQIEDVFITGVCADAASIPKYSHPLFEWSISEQDKCYINGILTSHKQKDANMIEAYKLAVDLDQYCNSIDLFGFKSMGNACSENSNYYI